MKTILTNTKDIIIYILTHTFMLACIFVGGYLLIDLLIGKWETILELTLYVSMVACGIIMTLTAIELTK